MTDPVFERLYTVKEAASILGIKERSLRTEIEAGRISFKRVAGKLMLRERDLREWMDQGERNCPDETAGRTSSIERTGAATTSSGPKGDGAADARRVRLITKKLKVGSPSSSPSDRDGTGLVIPANFGCLTR